ncbi:hypothetical protein Bca101_037533 [Brassica carinata]
MSKKIMLKSSDGESFEVEEEVARQSQTLANLIEDNCTDGEIPIANVTSKILGMVVEYCKKHVVVVDGGDDSSSSSTSEEDLKKWDADFMQIDQSTILLDLACQTVADMIAVCKSAAEIRAKFGIENDFTPEEEAEIVKENQWAFE